METACFREVLEGRSGIGDWDTFEFCLCIHRLYVCAHDITYVCSQYSVTNTGTHTHTCMHAYPTIPYTIYSTLYTIPYTLYPIPYTLYHIQYHIPTIRTVLYYTLPYRALCHTIQWPWHTREGIHMFAFIGFRCKMLTCPLTKHNYILPLAIQLSEVLE